MPPLIKSKRAAIDDNVVEFARSFWADTYRRMNEQITSSPLRQRDSLEHQLGPRMTALYAIFKSATKMDEELTRLRSLPFVRLEVAELRVSSSSKPVRYLVGHTRPIVIMDSGPYDMGTYTVYLPDTILREGIGTTKLHLVPDREPQTYARHPHHVCRGYGERLTCEPWYPESSTCWGGFSSVVNRIANDGDLVDLLRNIVIYLSRYDPGSPLTRIDSCPHAIEINRQKAKEILNGSTTAAVAA